MHNATPAMIGVHRGESLPCNMSMNPAVKVIVAMMKVSDMVMLRGG